MKNKKCFLTSGEFAKMNGINKRTLHYYNDIGLFRPEMIDENGYHYYSRFQAVQLEMILIFRRLGSPSKRSGLTQTARLTLPLPRSSRKNRSSSTGPSISSWR